MAKKLKIWNGRGHYKYDKGHIYVAAYTQKQAAELVSRACFGDENPEIISVNEIKKYYHDCWGTPMDGIEATEPGLWVQEKVYSDEKPIKVI